MAELQTHHPNELLLKEEPVHPTFQPGHMVSHGVDVQALGMVVARREDAGAVECDVLWSRVPTRQVTVPSSPRRPTVPVNASWTRTLYQEELWTDSTPSSFWAPARIEETFDGEELYEPNTLTPENIRDMQHMGQRTECTYHQDGSVIVTHRGVPRQWLPPYVAQQPPNRRMRYRDGWAQPDRW